MSNCKKYAGLPTALNGTRYLTDKELASFKLEAGKIAESRRINSIKPTAMCTKYGQKIIEQA